MIDYFETKAHGITKKMVLEAYKEIKNGGKAAGVDGINLTTYATNLSGNLYKLWNRMTSGSYYPSLVREKKIPKKDKGYRSLGIPTINDKIAQQVVSAYLEPLVDHTFHPDSYGYRRNKNAHQALVKAKERCDMKCWKWVIDLDISKFFDTINHELMMKALTYYTKEKWILLYVERWLKAGMLKEEGEIVRRENGTPQGGVISPLLANIYLHFAFDKWMDKQMPSMPFERYCDDVVIHCASKSQAEYVRDKIAKRLKECHLTINKEKSHIVYCRNEWRREVHENMSFNFLGYSFRPRYIKTVRGYMLSFTPEISRVSKRSINEKIREMNIRKFKGTVEQLAEKVNVKTRGWLDYYCKFNKWRTEVLWMRLNKRLIKWTCEMKKTCIRKALQWWKAIYKTKPGLFVHWKIAHL